MAKVVPNLTFRIEPGYTFSQELQAPQIDNGNLIVGGLPAGGGQESIFLGRIAEFQRSKNVWLDFEGAHAIYVMGKRRSGKTYTLGVLLEGLASSNWIRTGDTQQAILMFDTMNVLSTMQHCVEDIHPESDKAVQELRKWQLEREAFRIVLYYPRGAAAPPEGNLREISIRPCEMSAEDWVTLFGLDMYSDPMGQLISDLYERVVVDGYDLATGTRVPAKAEYEIDDLLTCMDTCQAIVAGYQTDTIRALKARLKAVARLPIFSGTGVPVVDLFVPGQITILLLRDLDQNLRSLLAGILVKKIMERRSDSDKYERHASVHLKRFHKLTSNGQQEQASVEEQTYKDYLDRARCGLPRGWIIVDEAHNYMPSKGVTPSAEPLKKYVNEGRNLGLSIVVATQNPAALDPSIRRNSDILIVHSISMRDGIAAAEGMLNTFLPDTFEFARERVTSRVFEQLVRSLPNGYAVVSNDRASRIFVAKVRPRITVHGGVEY